MYDLQRASVLKRIAAFMFDTMMLVIAFSLFAALFSWISGYNRHSAEYEAIRLSYEEEYGIQLDITAEEYEKLSDEVKAKYEAADAAIKEDEHARAVYAVIFRLAFSMTAAGVVFAFLLLEFAVPLLLRNGQTLGKKMFGVGVMQIDGVRLRGPVLFARSMLVKCALETMIPVLVLVMVILGTAGPIPVMIALGMPVLQIALVATTKNRLALHDVISSTVCVDLASQMIFETREDRKAYEENRAE